MVAHGLMVKNFEHLFRSGRWNDGNWITLRIGITGTQSGQTLSCTDLWISGWWFNIFICFLTWDQVANRLLHIFEVESK